MLVITDKDGLEATSAKIVIRLYDPRGALHSSISAASWNFDPARRTLTFAKSDGTKETLIGLGQGWLCRITEKDADPAT